MFRVFLIALIPFIPIILRHVFNAIEERDKRKEEENDG